MKQILLALALSTSSLFAAPQSALITTKSLIVNVPEGSYLKIFNLATTSDFQPVPVFYIYTNPATGNKTTLQSTWGGPENLVYGPIEVKFAPTDSLKKPAKVYVRYEVREYNADFRAQGTAMIPSDANGKMDVILEKSTELKNWVSALPGEYGATSSTAYFRVRIVKK